jgi:hypothetical protein
MKRTIVKDVCRLFLEEWFLVMERKGTKVLTLTKSSRVDFRFVGANGKR